MTKKYLIVTILFLLTFAPAIKADTVSGIINTGSLQLSGIVIGPPTALPVAGTYNSAQTISLTKPAGAKNIFYTTDGSVPDCSSAGQIYSLPINVGVPETIKAVSCYIDGSVSTSADFAYIIQTVVAPMQLPSLLTSGVFALPADGSTSSSTTSINVTQQVSINVDNNSVVIPQNTVITSVTGDKFSADTLTATSVNKTSLAGLTSGAVVEGALQWGIANLSLHFDTPISLSIFVGTDLNGQTLNVQRSAGGQSGWTSDGIVSPATCLVTNGFCNFQATKASYYATYKTVAVVTTSNTSSSGGGGPPPATTSTTTTATPAVTTTTTISGDINSDNIIDELDFSVIMSQWDQTGTNLSADLNKDGVVDELDFSILMAGWSS